MYATHGRYDLRVSNLKHYYGLNHLYYLTTRTYRRARRGGLGESLRRHVGG